MLFDILQTQAPISEEELFRTTVACYGVNKLVKSVRRGLEKSAELIPSDHFFLKDGFYYRKNQDVIKPRLWMNHSDVRPIDSFAGEELEIIVSKILDLCYRYLKLNYLVLLQEHWVTLEEVQRYCD